MKYQKALEMIEQWLEKKKIREYCRTECKGKCCQAICNGVECKRPPLPCAVFLCKDLRKELFGFHNGERYHDTYLAITRIVFGSDDFEFAVDELKGVLTDDDVKVNIPNKLINTIITMEYEPDNHGWPKNAEI